MWRDVKRCEDVTLCHYVIRNDKMWRDVRSPIKKLPPEREEWAIHMLLWVILKHERQRDSIMKREAADTASFLPHSKHTGVRGVLGRTVGPWKHPLRQGLICHSQRLTAVPEMCRSNCGFVWLHVSFRNWIMLCAKKCLMESKFMLIFMQQSSPAEINQRVLCRGDGD